MASIVVEQAVGEDNGTGTSTNINSDDGWSPPTAGNLLIVAGAAEGDGAGLHTISFNNSFAIAQSYTAPTNQFYCCYAVGWKVSDGTEGDNVGESNTITMSMATAPTTSSVSVMEISSSDFDFTTLDASNDDETNANAGGSGSTQTSLTGAATNSTASALAIGIHMVQAGSDWATRSWSNSFTDQHFYRAAARTSVSFATKILTSTGSQSSTITTTDTGHNNYGAILIFGATAAPASVPGIEVIRNIPGVAF